MIIENVNPIDNCKFGQSKDIKNQTFAYKYSFQMSHVCIIYGAAVYIDIYTQILHPNVTYVVNGTGMCWR